jgi:hypothetical protein
MLEVDQGVVNQDETRMIDIKKREGRVDVWVLWIEDSR